MVSSLIKADVPAAVTALWLAKTGTNSRPDRSNI
jgi:G:T-mismatch repair DNA endonuclease (very short patch repair protein)